MMTHTELLHEAVNVHLKTAIQNFLSSKADDTYKDKLRSITVKVSINPRMKSAAGRAIKTRIGGSLEIELNPKLFNRCSFEERYETVSHEMAHIVDFAIRGRSNHDLHWKQLHMFLGGKAARCHRINMKGIGGRDWLVICKTTGKQWWVTARKMRKVHPDKYEMFHISSKDVAKYEKAV